MAIRFPVDLDVFARTGTAPSASGGGAAMNERWHCSVPGCRRTMAAQRPQEPDDWFLCQKHWPLVPRAAKAALRRCYRRWEKAYARSSPPGTFHRREDWLASLRAGSAHRRLSRRVVAIAIEKALGI